MAQAVASRLLAALRTAEAPGVRIRLKKDEPRQARRCALIPEAGPSPSTSGSWPLSAAGLSAAKPTPESIAQERVCFLPASRLPRKGRVVAVSTYPGAERPLALRLSGLPAAPARAWADRRRQVDAAAQPDRAGHRRRTRRGRHRPQGRPRRRGPLPGAGGAQRRRRRARPGRRAAAGRPQRPARRQPAGRADRRSGAGRLPRPLSRELGTAHCRTSCTPPCSPWRTSRA